MYKFIKKKTRVRNIIILIRVTRISRHGTNSLFPRVISYGIGTIRERRGEKKSRQREKEFF